MASTESHQRDRVEENKPAAPPDGSPLPLGLVVEAVAPSKSKGRDFSGAIHDLPCNASEMIDDALYGRGDA